MLGPEMKIPDRVWLHTSETERRVIDPSDVYFLEADGDSTWIRFARKRRVRDVRELGQVVQVFARFGFLRVHREHAVNARRIYEVRKRKGKQDWELKLEAPVNRVLPISRSYMAALRAAYGD